MCWAIGLGVGAVGVLVWWAVLAEFRQDAALVDEEQER